MKRKRVATFIELTEGERVLSDKKERRGEERGSRRERMGGQEREKETKRES